MRWSKVRKLVEDSFAESVKGRVKIHSTNYRCSCVRAWIEIDGKVVANCDDRLNYAVFRGAKPVIPNDVRSPGSLAERGEFRGEQFNDACWQYLNSSLRDSLSSDDPLIVSLAVLSEKVGRTRLTRLATADLHPLPKALVHFRVAAEKKIRVTSAAASPQRN